MAKEWQFTTGSEKYLPPHLPISSKYNGDARHTEEVMEVYAQMVLNIV